MHQSKDCGVVEPSACALIIPCLNEGARIAALVGEALPHLRAIVVVDDGSTDTTSAAAQAAGATVVRHARNCGKGAALRTGLSLAGKQGYEWAFTLDGDGQHAPGDIPAFLHCAVQTGALLVVGNRMHNAQAMPWLRRQVNLWMSHQLSRRAGRQLPDTQCGFRLLQLKAWAGLSLRTERFEVESEMLMAFLAAQYPVAFVPIQVLGQRRRSRIHPLADTLRWWRWWHGLAQAPPQRS
jgi:glycosyltransferase involved in cell wall biosynthesis